jgi:hypothetical protein
MKLRTVWSLWVLLISLSSLKCAEQPERCLFSIEIITDGGGLQRAGGSSVGDKISLCEWKGGWITAERHIQWHGECANKNPDDLRFGSGPEFTSEIRGLLKAADLGRLDFHAELAKAKKVAGDNFMLIGGVRVRVNVDDGTNHFSFIAEGLSPLLDRYSTYSPRLNGLKVLVDRLELEYGRRLMYF